MGIVEQNQAGGKYASRQGVARLPHDEENHGDCERAEQRRERSVRHVWYIVGDVRVSDIVKLEIAVVADKPSNKGE